MNFSTKSETSVLLAAIIVAAGTLIQVSAYTGGEVSIKLNNTQFTRLNDTGNYQIKVSVDYSVTDPTLIGQKINAVEGVFFRWLITKNYFLSRWISSNKTGRTHLLTNIPISTAQKITTETIFTISTRQINYRIPSIQLLIRLSL